MGRRDSDCRALRLPKETLQHQRVLLHRAWVGGRSRNQFPMVFQKREPLLTPPPTNGIASALNLRAPAP
jgi:hypothetical protein